MNINYKYIVKEQAWHNVVILLCFPDNKPSSSSATTTTMIATNTTNAMSLDSRTFVLVNKTNTSITTNNIIISTNNYNNTINPSLKRMLSTQNLSTLFITPHLSPTTISTTTTNTIRSSNTTTTKKHLEYLSTETIPVAYMTGTITFRNPYGFIPGESFGLLPFEVS